MCNHEALQFSIIINTFVIDYHFFVYLQRNITEGQKESLVKDFNGLNLSKYVGEAVSIGPDVCKMCVFI